MAKLALVLCAVVLISLAHTAPVDRTRLRFRLSGRDLPDKDKIGTADPYVELFYTENGKKDEVKLGRTATLDNNENPDWGDIFEFDFDRSKNQRWHFKVYDHDNAREDDSLGKAYIDVADFVDKGQRMNVNLSKKGYLILSAVDTPTQAPQQQVVPLVVAPAAPAAVAVAQAPQTVYTTNPDTMRLRFKLSARDLPDKDKLGSTDPYVELFYTEGGSSKESKFGRTATINDNKNPDWGDVFEFDFDRRKNQKWLFRVYDHDQGREDDSAGKVWVDVADFVSKGQKLNVNLSKKGTLQVTGSPTAAVAPPSTVYVQQPQQPGFVAPVQPVILAPISPIAVVEQPVKLRFKLSAKSERRRTLKSSVGADMGLEDKDLIGTSDPYTKIWYRDDGSSSEVLIGSTTKLNDNENPVWTDTFEFLYDKTKKPKWHFLILDEDDNRTDDVLGDIWVDVSEYVLKNQKLDLKLKKGTLTISSA